MKTIPGIVRAAILAAAVLAMAGRGSAQSAAPALVTRADVTGSLSWLAVEKAPIGQYAYSPWHHTLFGAVGAGWYWNDNLKTEVDFGVGRENSAYGGRQIVVDGLPAFVSTESTFSRRIVGISQQYQFYRNAWFHPHVAAGADITWQRITDVTSDVVIYDRPGPPRLLEAGHTDGPRTEVTARPFLATGFKAYLTSRTFLRSDARVGFRGGVDEVLLRFGFGVDF